MRLLSLALLLFLALALAGCTAPDSATVPTPVAPAPILAPPVFPGFVVVCTQPNCPPCDRLKAELAQVPGVSIRYVDVSTRVARAKYRVHATPTLIHFSGPREVARKEGFMTATEFAAWIVSVPVSTPARDVESGAK